MPNRAKKNIRRGQKYSLWVKDSVVGFVLVGDTVVAVVAAAPVWNRRAVGEKSVFFDRSSEKK